MPKFRRHFVFKHPLFRSKETETGVPWQRSVYYLWWEFLRRHEGYRETCLNGGGGRYASLYADFGDIHSMDFKEWWQGNDRGATLFAEPAVPISVEKMKPSDLARLPTNWDQQGLMIVAIPLSFPKRDIERRLNQIIKENHTRKRGERLLKSSKALYPVRGQFNFYSLKSILEVYDLKKNRPELTLWQIAQELRITTTLTAEEQKGRRGDPTSVAKRAVMAAVVSRKLRKAVKIIESAGKGMFPYE